MAHPGILRVIGSAVLYSVFAKIQKENGMPAKIMVSRTDHTPPDLRELASKNNAQHARRGSKTARFQVGVD